MEKGELKYAIGIPTFGRLKQLQETLEAIYEQTHPPALIVVVDNNLDDANAPMFGSMFSPNQSPDYIEVIRKPHNKYPRSDAVGSQIALDIFSERGYDIGIKWDDDLVPEKDCLGKLVRIVAEGVVMAGGMYPGGMVGVSHQEDGKVMAGDDKLNHLQFFKWQGDHIRMMIGSLYSSFAYNVELAQLVGGFCTEYSQQAYRHETDFSLRMNRMASFVTNNHTNLAVDTAAVAEHRMSEGGVRSIPPDERLVLQEKDQELFLKRMKAMKIRGFSE